MEKIIATADSEGEQQQLDFGHTNFGMPERALSGDVDEAIGYTGMGAVMDWCYLLGSPRSVLSNVAATSYMWHFKIKSIK